MCMYSYVFVWMYVCIWGFVLCLYVCHHPHTYRPSYPTYRSILDHISNGQRGILARYVCMLVDWVGRLWSSTIIHHHLHRQQVTQHLCIYTYLQALAWGITIGWVVATSILITAMPLLLEVSPQSSVIIIIILILSPFPPSSDVHIYSYNESKPCLNWKRSKWRNC